MTDNSLLNDLIEVMKSTEIFQEANTEYWSQDKMIGIAFISSLVLGKRELSKYLWSHLDKEDKKQASIWIKEKITAMKNKEDSVEDRFFCRHHLSARIFNDGLELFSPLGGTLLFKLENPSIAKLFDSLLSWDQHKTKEPQND